MGGSEQPRIDRVTGWTGRVTLHGVGFLLDFTAFILVALREWQLLGSLRKRIGYTPIVNQIAFGGLAAFPLITTVGLAMGFVVTYRLVNLLSLMGQEAVSTVLLDLIAMELGSLITALIFISRSGSAIAVDLANMKLHGEVETLEILGIDINHYVIAPRMIGAAFSQLILATYFTVLVLVGGIVLGGILISASYFTYLQGLLSALEPQFILAFTFKNLIFGLLIGAGACFFGLQVDKSHTEIPGQMQSAIISGLVLVFITDGLFALALL